MLAATGHVAASVRRARRPARPGQTPVEFALVCLLVLALVLLVVQGGILTANWLTVGNTAREGARVGATTTATDEQILAAVNRTAANITGGFSALTAHTPPAGCTAVHALCVCRHPPTSSDCAAAASRGDVVTVTVRRRVSLLPVAGGFLGQAAGIQLTAHEQARIE